MLETLQTSLRYLLDATSPHPIPHLDLAQQFASPPDTEAGGYYQKLNAAWLIKLAGPDHPAYLAADQWLTEQSQQTLDPAVLDFYQTGLSLIPAELAAIAPTAPALAQRLAALADWLQQAPPDLAPAALAEQTWSVFFPEGQGIRGEEAAQIEALRQTRSLTLTQLNADPISAPAREVLFSANALLTVPTASMQLAALDLAPDLKQALETIAQEPQRYWYDHPIPLGVPPENNEILYGLRALNQAIDFERQRGTLAAEDRVTCLLSVSVTHEGLQSIAKPYLNTVLTQADNLANLAIYAFTEADTQALIQAVLLPALQHYLPDEDGKALLSVFGVDGRYGRHYSFLKAIATLWQVLIDPQVKGTFKIDLDQVFPQTELVAETGQSAFEHLCTPLWGAEATDSQGQPLELGLIAGALVNQRDIDRGLFTADVTFPQRDLTPDEFVFFSALPQALSTEAEMMTRYTQPPLDGTQGALQRIHVTGGTNGILIDSLRRHRPFTPSFIGRAEDQAYVLSAFTAAQPARLAYVHEPGLIMRHDKEGFAQDAIQQAKVGKLVGDYVRILLFSTYARVLSADLAPLKQAIDPFTGCFVSTLPITLVYLRFALKVASLFAAGELAQATEVVQVGVTQLTEALALVQTDGAALRHAYEQERLGWDRFYEVLAILENGLRKGDDFAIALQQQAQKIVAQCGIG